VREKDFRVLGPDSMRVAGSRPFSTNLTIALGAYPLSVPVQIKPDRDANGVVAHLTWPLFRYLKRVETQHYSPLSLDPEHQQQLDRLSDALSAEAAEVGGVAVLTPTGAFSCDWDEEEPSVRSL
jgi:hypothetical protein